MSTVLDLPTVVYSFLDRPAPQSLLIRGPPGTGQSTLASDLLEHFRDSRCLISGRVNGPELRREFSWMTQNGNIHLIDAAGRAGRLKDAARALGASGVGRRSS